MGVLTLIRAKEEDSGNYTMRVENGDQVRSVGLILEVKGQRRMTQALYYFYFLSQPCSPSYSLSFSNVLTRTFASPPLPTVPAVIVDLMDIHHGSATGQSVVCITRGQPTPVVEWFICKNIKQ